MRITLKQQLRKRLQRVRIFDLGGGPEDSVLVAGTARSGTTWIGDVIAHATRSRAIFEPFLQNVTGQFSLLTNPTASPTLFQPYAAASDETPGGAAIESILAGRLRRQWCDRFTASGWYSRRLIKAVRVNLLLDYLATRFPQIRIVYVVRNPVSVVNSQLAKMRAGWSMEWAPAFVLDQPRLMQDWLSPYRDLIEEASGVVERQAIKWCVENLVPCQQLPKHSNVLQVSYDRLIVSSSEWVRIAQFLADRSWSPQRFHAMADHVSSTAERCRQSIRQRVERLSELNLADRRRIEEIVERFGLERWLNSASSAVAA